MHAGDLPTALFVLSGIEVDTDQSLPLAVGGVARVVEPWIIDQSRLKLISYTYTVPSL